MGTGWAVGSAATLGFAAAFGTAYYAGPLYAPAFSFPAFFAVAMLGCWAYALSRGAYGSKGALAALLAYDVVVGLGLCGAWPLLGPNRATGAFLVLAVLCALVSLLAAGATIGELRQRRGPVQWGTAFALAWPMLVVVPAALTSAFAPLR